MTWKGLTLAVWVGASGCLVPQAMVDRYLDRDGDGERASGVGGTDCDDDDPRVGAGAVEVCGNDLDDDCDGQRDEDGVGASTFYTDADGDDFGDGRKPVLACELVDGLAAQPGDCDDLSRSNHPGAKELCSDEVDNDCDGNIDEQDDAPFWRLDGDGDGFGSDVASPVQACLAPEGYTDLGGDCDDSDGARYPRAREVPYDNIDQDCAGDDDFDLDGDGWRVKPGTESEEILDQTYPHGVTLDCDDLEPLVYYGAPDTPYDGIDGDCMGDDDFDVDGDGHRAADHGGDDCDDNDFYAHPGFGETLYDGVDQDCDPLNDDDGDGDGHAADFRGGDDCDDHEPDVWLSCATCVDDDLDGYRTGCDRYGSRAYDCDDSDPRAWVSCGTCGDADGDGRWGLCDDNTGLFPDCDDDDDTVWNRCSTCLDNDGDGVRGRCDVAEPIDCDDTLTSAWTTCDTCEDEDEDGFGVGVCDAPTLDCDDANPNGTITCAPCEDEDGDYAYVGCDRYETVLWDCDDADPERGGATAEILGDGVDQDCDGDDLTVDEEHGVFVSANTGEDEPGCGTRGYPCETQGWASSQHPGAIVFMAAGAYDGVRGAHSVYGGFDPVSWERDLEQWPTVLENRTRRPLDVVGRLVVVDGVEVDGNDSYPGVPDTKVRAVAAIVRHVSVNVESPAACGALSIDAPTSHTHSVSIEASCGASASGLGTNNNSFLGVPRVASTIEDVQVTVRSLGETVGIETTSDVAMFSAASIQAWGAGSCATLKADVKEHLSLEQADLYCEAGNQGRATSISTTPTGSKMISRVTAAARAGHAVVIGGDLGADDSLWVVNSALDADGGLSAYGVDLLAVDGSGTVQLVGSSIRATGSDSHGVQSRGLDMRVQNTLIVASVEAIVPFTDHLVLEHSWVSAPCLSVYGDLCVLPTSPEYRECGPAWCATPSNLSVGDPSVIWPFAGPPIPSVASPLVDAGAQSLVHGSVDLLGSARVAGTAPDIGCVEAR